LIWKEAGDANRHGDHVLEGELMVKMGEILIQHGRAMQEQTTEKKGK